MFIAVTPENLLK